MRADSVRYRHLEPDKRLAGRSTGSGQVLRAFSAILMQSAQIPEQLTRLCALLDEQAGRYREPYVSESGINVLFVCARCPAGATTTAARATTSTTSSRWRPEARAGRAAVRHHPGGLDELRRSGLAARAAEIARRRHEVDELLDIGRRLVEGVERLVCRLYAVPDPLTDLVVASAIARSGTVAQEAD